MKHIALIGGTGFEKLPPEIFAEEVEVGTPYGQVRLLSVSENYTEPRKLYFLSRHGARHQAPPHLINYRANMAALDALDVGWILASNAVGALTADLTQGTFVVPDDFIDFTRGRPLTMYDLELWAHTDFSSPYGPAAREALLTALLEANAPHAATGVYVCVEGPRFETPAEVRMYRGAGGTVVGMTGLPEAILARELGIQYASLSLVTNLGAGLTPYPIEHQQVAELASGAVESIREILLAAARRIAAGVVA